MSSQRDHYILKAVKLSNDILASFLIFDSKSSITFVNFQVKMRKKKKWRIIENYDGMKQLNFSPSAKARRGEVR